jgi:hypothetical protein
MNVNRVLPFVVLGILLVLAGCPQGGAGGIITIDGEINATDNGFRLDGDVVEGSSLQPTYRNVTVYLYTDSGTVIDSKQLGTLNESVVRLDVSMQTDRVPKYVIVNSPDFWDDVHPDLNYYVLTKDSQTGPNGIYSEYNVGSKDEFPVKVPPNETRPSR